MHAARSTRWSLKSGAGSCKRETTPPIVTAPRVVNLTARVGKGALCAPCPPLATDRVGTARAIELACHSNDWSARAFAHPTNVIQFHRDLL